ncbi:uncharacterized protein BJ171DRAFT_143742, partial [Polychytrium aggregatum]|uniref:uncharacterized protein n=1 Tax=Polychytrium aggregatum TaxID=110093 RepID=UPI0022FE5F3D
PWAASDGVLSGRRERGARRRPAGSKKGYSEVRSRAIGSASRGGWQPCWCLFAPAVDSGNFRVWLESPIQRTTAHPSQDFARREHIQHLPKTRLLHLLCDMPTPRSSLGFVLALLVGAVQLLAIVGAASSSSSSATLSHIMEVQAGSPEWPQDCPRRSSRIPFPLFASKFIYAVPRSIAPLYMIFMAYKTDVQVRTTILKRQARILQALDSELDGSVVGRTSNLTLAPPGSPQPILPRVTARDCLAREILLLVDDTLLEFQHAELEWSNSTFADLPRFTSSSIRGSSCRRLTKPPPFPRTLEKVAADQQLDKVYEGWKSDTKAFLLISSHNVRTLEMLLDNAIQASRQKQRPSSTASTIKPGAGHMGLDDSDFDCVLREMNSLLVEYVHIARSVAKVMRSLKPV